MEKLLSNELALRVCSALILVFIFFLSFYYNFFPSFIGLVALLTFFELFKILSLEKVKSFFAIVLIPFIYLSFEVSSFSTRCLIFFSCFFLSVILIRMSKGLSHLFLPAVFITPFLYASISLYREYEQILILFCVLFIASVDIGGYFVGKFFGSHQLFPKISPKKTYEGLLGSVLFLLFSLTLFFKSSYYDLYKPDLIVLFFIFLFFSVYGDYLESFLKRKFNIKDSGNFIPGHGGILDRLDAMLFTIPAFYIYLSYLVSYD
ncbi:MAG: phosphatidate cytidylyltransferase [Nitrosomonadales bacterium]